MIRKLVLLTAVLAAVTLTACKSDPSDSASSAAPTTSGAVSAESTISGSAGAAVAEASPTTVAEPTATSGLKTIEVVGDEAFTAWTQQALDLIQTRAPEAYEAVLASIDTIESVSAGSGMYVEEKRYAVGDQTAHAPGYDEAGQLVWFAGTIVHDAHHSALFAEGAPYTGKEAELDCLAVQKAALALLTDDPFFANYVQSVIDGVDDPANQYWTQPDRHW